MPQVNWQASGGDRYWIDVAIGTSPLQVMIDSGLVDPLDRVGFELEPIVYRQFKRSGQLSRFARRLRRDASGSHSWSESGVTTAQLIDPITGHLVGPSVQIEVSHGSAGVPNRVGVVFFHRLNGCRVVWDLDSRNWCIEYP